MKRKVNLKKKLWKIFSQYIRQRNLDEYGDAICFTCGARNHYTKMDAGHYIAASLGLATYFDERNVQIQCTSCNRFRHGNLHQFALKLREKYGDKILEDLENLRQTFRKISAPEYLELIEQYKKKLENINQRKALS